MSDELWWAMPVLAGRLIRLEPLALEHGPGYLAAAGTGGEAAEVFRWMSPPGGALAQPVTLDDATRHIAGALASRARGARLPYAQIDAATGGHGPVRDDRRRLAGRQGRAHRPAGLAVF